jgi:hypothetical protein
MLNAAFTRFTLPKIILLKPGSVIAKQVPAFLAFVGFTVGGLPYRNAAVGTAVGTAAVDAFCLHVRSQINIQNKERSDKDQYHPAFKSERHCVRHKDTDGCRDPSQNQIGQHPEESVP